MLEVILMNRILAPLKGNAELLLYFDNTKQT